jgi:hypothetical protein
MGLEPGKALTTSSWTRCSSARAPTAALKTCAKPQPSSRSWARKSPRTSSWPWWCRAPVWSRHRPKREGLHEIFKAAGFEWREPGCSMCLAMNADRLEPGERCASTSNRNFEGRQGAGGRTHLVSPAMAAAAAVHGHFVDIRQIPKECPMKKLMPLIGLGRSFWLAATPCAVWARMSESRLGHRRRCQEEVNAKIHLHKGLVAPMDRENVDTDAIIPKQFLKSIRKTGFGPNLFDEWRYLDPASPARTRQPQTQPGLCAEPAALRKVRPSCWRARTLAAARRANTRPGRWTSTAFAPSSRPALPTSSSTTASRTACCPSCCPKRWWTSCSTRPRPSLATSSRSTWSARSSSSAGRRNSVRGAGLPQVLPAQRL